MYDYNLPIYDMPKEWIRMRRKKGDSWDVLMLARKSSEIKLQNFLSSRGDDDGWPDMTIEEWKGLVKYLKQMEEPDTSIDESIWALGEEQDNEIDKVPENPQSSWQTYKNYLLEEKHFGKDTVDEMERATFRIIRRLRANINDGPGKGLVVGNVQSGKTANMAALMAMAADWGWNFIIVLSGTIENLRIQTRDRLFEDLSRPNCNLDWIVREKLRPNHIDSHERQSALNLGPYKRYFTVYLKNSTNLKNLLKWLQEDPKVQKNMKVMVIDDEADQAGINTGDIDLEESSTINQLIKNLVNGNTPESGLRKSRNSNYPIKKSNGAFASLNYIGYTATPYANVLNEFGEETLYPKDFIAVLKGSKEYFGPQQIFGNSEDGYDGVDIVKEISPEDNEGIKALHKGLSHELPDSFKDAIRWFLCGVACRRYWGDTKPVTMLIHTHHQNAQHDRVAAAVEAWLTDTPKDVQVKESLLLYDREKVNFTKSDLLREYHDYCGNPNEIRDLPDSNDLKPFLTELLQGDISPIPMAEDGKLEYHKGIHLCIDNCQHNGPEDGMVMKLIYPNKKNKPNFAPAFIVVGGATLSRGLTLEGLISTYFLRTTKTCDTLMQMGRWFGYRRGYELLPRLWMTRDTQAKFEFLSDLDHDLRMEIQRMAANGISPSECGPKVLNSPNLTLLKIVAPNKQQSAEETDFDFSGVHKETTIFECDADTLRNNLQVTENLISHLGKPEPWKECNKHAKNVRIWRLVSNDSVMDFLSAFKFSSRQRFFNDLEPFKEWMQMMVDEGHVSSWNVVLVGIAENLNGSWECGEASVNKVTRTPLADQAAKGVINIKRLLDPHDMLADINLEDADKETLTTMAEAQKKNSPEYTRILRRLNGLDKTPRLMLYVINKDSKASSDKRVDLNAPEDLIGIDLQIPGGSIGTSKAKRLTIKIPEDLKSYKTEDED